MSNQDSGGRVPMSRLSQLQAEKNSDESGYKTKKQTDESPPAVTSGRGRMFTALAAARAAETKEVVSSSSSASAGRGKFLAMIQSSSVGETSGSKSTERTPEQTTAIQTAGDTSRPETAGRGRFLSMLKSQKPAESQAAPAAPVSSAPVSGRGRLLSLAKQQAEAPAPPVIPIEKPSYEVQSTSEALAQLRLKRREESSHSSEKKTMPTIQELQAQAAPLQEHVEEVAVEAKSGTCGRTIQALTNFVKLEVGKDNGLFEYEVRFDPPAHAQNLRFQLLNQQAEVIGKTKTFDGVKLCLPMQLPDQVTQLTSINSNDDTPVVLTLIYKGKRKFSDCIQFYGILFSNIMKILKFVRFGTKDFDPSEPKVVPQHKLEIWPGYVTAVEECHGGVMLAVDVTHRVLRQTAVIDIFQHAYQSSRGNKEDFRDKVQKALIGAVVLTRYNNKTYRIDDIDWDKTPMDSFQTKTGEITYVQYYKQQYNIDIKDKKQPLLISHDDKRVSGQKEKVTFTFSIIPEISYLTGLTDEQRADFKIMRDVAVHTRISPNQRAQQLVEFCKRVNSKPETKQLLSNWGLRLSEDAVGLQARILDEEKVFFGNNRSFGVGPNADFGKYCTNNTLVSVKPLHNWLLIHVKNDLKAAKAFVDGMERNTGPMGITVSKPKIITLENDKTDTYAQTLRQALNVQTQIVVCICPTARDDRYAVIKKICCAESPIPSQVINARTLSNEAKNRSIIQKIALQINCKLGGSLWSIKIPLKEIMIVGIDTYHDKKTGSVSAFVASTNDTFTSWYSKAVVQNRNEELVHGLVVSLEHALKAYKKLNNCLPKKIVIFRDGVGDGQLKAVKDYELAQLKQACVNISPEYQPLFTMVVVQKRINARFYVSKGANQENPQPGSVVDHTITRKGLYDFYLVPQSVRQGTVTPTHCIVVEDANNFAPDHLQRLTYKLCFLYYNWPGTVRVPACCQYAHKLAYLVGQSMKREPAEQLNDRLFYL